MLSSIAEIKFQHFELAIKIRIVVKILIYLFFTSRSLINDQECYGTNFASVCVCVFVFANSFMF